MKVKLNDSLIFDVQGVAMKVKVTSIREVNWKRVETNFVVLFPKGVLESAPQFYALMTRVETKKQSADFQLKLLNAFPNVSIIDLNSILETVTKVINKIKLVIQFMAFLSILTGLIVLIGTIRNSKYQRLKESVLLRTLGASKKQIVRITVIEYLALGILAALAGVLLGLLSCWLLNLFVFEIEFGFDPSQLFIILFGIISVVTILGYFSNQFIFRRSPLEVLRREVN